MVFFDSRDSRGQNQGWWSAPLSGLNAALVVGVISALAIALFSFKSSVMVGGDFPRYTFRGAQLYAMLAGAPVSDVTLDVWTILYAVPNFLIAGGDLLFGDFFPLLFVWFNATLFIALSFLMTRLWVGNQTIAMGRLLFVPPILFGMPFDLLPHIFWVLSDVLFMFVVGGTLVALAWAVLHNSSRGWWWAFSGSLVALFCRPPGVVLFIFVGLAWVYRFLQRRSFPLWGLCSLFVLLPALITFLIWPLIVLDQHQNGGWEQLAPLNVFSMFSWGVVVVERTETYTARPDQFADFLWIEILRFLYYAIPLREAYSTLHNISLALYTFYVTFFMFKGWLYLGQKGAAGRDMRALLLLCPLYFALFHSMLFIEDFRFQLPALMAVWVLAGFGAIGSVKRE